MESDDSRLRIRAEETIAKKHLPTPKDVESLTYEESRLALHELQVHRIELEMQNEELRRVQVELDEARAKYFDLYDLAPMGYCILSTDDRILEANLTAARLLGVPRSEIARHAFTRFIMIDDQNVYYLHRKKLVDTSLPQESELRMRKADGTLFWAHLECTIAFDAEGNTLCRIAISDITARIASDELLKKYKSMLDQVQIMGKVGGWEFDVDTLQQTWSEEVYRIFELDFGPAIEVPKGVEFYVPSSKPIIDRAVQRARDLGESFDHELEITTAKGNHRYVHVIGKADLKQRKVTGFIQDITEQKRAEEQILRLSYYDKLTGLFNRRYYEEELPKFNTAKNMPLSFIIGDVNGLKMINDSYGHAKGDEVLRNVAAMMASECSAGEILVRLSGDEFAILMPKMGQVKAKQLMGRLRKHIAREHIGLLEVSVAFGSATKLREDDCFETIFKNAEDVMYVNKNTARRRIQHKTIGLIMMSLIENNYGESRHSQRVSRLCGKVANRMGFGDAEISRIMLAGLMHDIGKIGIRESILHKVGILTDEERIEMQQHPEIGYRVLRSVSEFSDISDYVWQHHERWDGRGFPNGLKGKEILLPARIIAVVDAYDAMTSDRSYRTVDSMQDAIDCLMQNAGTQFDPEVVEVFTAMLR